MADQVNTQQGLTIDQALAQLKANRVQAQGEPEQLEEGGVEVDEEEYEDDTPDAEDYEEEDQDSEGDDSEEEGDESEESEASEEEEIFEVEVDGEVVEVTGEELRKGYLRHNDYTRKRQADAKRAKELETEYQTKLQALDTVLAQNVSQEQQQLIALQKAYQQETDVNNKRNLHYQMLQLQQLVGQRKAQQQQAAQLREQTMKAQAEAHWKQQEDALRAQFENWDEKKTELVGYLQGQGFEDLSMFTHAKMAELVDKAKQFDELQLKRKDVSSKKLKRKVPKVMKPGQGEQQIKRDQRLIQELEQRFKQTGSIKDAQALMRAKRGNK